MSKCSQLLTALFSSLLLVATVSSDRSAAKNVNPVDFVNPIIGTAGAGHTYPGATVPFGMVQLSPDTGTDGWQWCSGYNYQDRSIIGFSHTHLSGTGCSDLGDFLFAPTVGAIKLSAGSAEKPLAGYRSLFSHADEEASPGYYCVKLQNCSVKAELTASEHVGLHRYTFPEESKANIIIDLGHGIGNVPLSCELNVIGDRILTGFRRTSGWAKDRSLFFAAEFSKPFSSFGTAEDEARPMNGNRRAQGKYVKGWVTFQTQTQEPIVVKVALSTTGIDGAMRNLKTEVPGFDFDSARAAASQSWSRELGRIQVKQDGEAKKELETFYTALYHCLLAPTVISDVDGAYRGSDHELHHAPAYRIYSTFSLWDTFRAEHPLLTILQPKRVNEMIRSLACHAEFQTNNTLPIWPLYANETYCMIGYHSFPVIAEAYAKGLRDFDAKALFQLMVENSKRNDYWQKRGYMASDCDLESVSKTLEFAYDDWALAQLARALGQQSDYERFNKRACAYKNLFDAQTGFMRGRLADGTWHSPFDPGDLANHSLDFCEGDAWQYSFFVPQDVQGLIALYGGTAPFLKKLDTLFSETPVFTKDADHDISGMIGQYAHGNEPSHHIAYLYGYAGQPWKTQDRVEQIRQELYSNSPDGLCGNEDCGQMSAWYVFSALGFYPVNPVQGTYILGKPMFHECQITTPTGNELIVLSKNLSAINRYISEVRLNGQPLQRVFLTHTQLCAGGTLEFIMAPEPSSTWAIQPAAAPPAMTGLDQIDALK